MQRRRDSKITIVVRERVEILLSEAHKIAKSNLARARRYIKLARRLAEKYRVRFTRVQKMHFCKKCNTPFIPGHNVKIGFDLRAHQIIYECRNCGAIIKFPYKSRKLRKQ